MHEPAVNMKTKTPGHLLFSGSKFNSQPLVGCLHQSVTSDPWDLVPYSDKDEHSAQT